MRRPILAFVAATTANSSIYRVAKVAHWLSFPAPFIALALCWYCRFSHNLPDWLMRAAAISFARHFGFFASGSIALFALTVALARRELRWIWLPLVGLILTIMFAAETQSWQ